MKNEGRPQPNRANAVLQERRKKHLLINYIDTPSTATAYSSLPVIGHGPEPEWFTRRVAAVERLRELERERQIARLTAGPDGSNGVVIRFRSAFGLA